MTTPRVVGTPVEANSEPRAPERAVDRASRQLETLIRARYPILAIASHEEERVLRTVGALATRRKRKLLAWTVTRGFFPPEKPVDASRGATTDPLAALDEVVATVDPTIFVLLDFHPFLRADAVVRRLRDVAQHLRGTYSTVVLLSPHLTLPAELDKDVTVVDFPLPDRAELQGILDRTLREVRESAGLAIERGAVAEDAILGATLGLTEKEAENVLAKSLVLGGRLGAADVPLILEEKRQIVRRSGYLEDVAVEPASAEVGGLEHLRAWLDKRRLAFGARARAAGLPFPKGLLLVGVQGCGKSLSAKAAAQTWQLPLLRLDVGRVFAGVVGSSENNMRRAIEAAEAVAPAILWVDEIEKAFSGLGSSDTSDGGTTARVFATFLTWLQEKRSPVFVFATANSVARLPPELVRKGRLDELFFVDLPTARERRAVLGIHLARRGVTLTSGELDALAQSSDGFSGAELEQAVIAASFDAFAEGLAPTTAHVARALQETVPLSRTMADQIDALRAWARGRARPASLADDELGLEGRRRRVEL